MNWTTPLWLALAPHMNKGSTFFLQPKSSSLVFLTLYFKTWLYIRALLSLLQPVRTNRLYTWGQNWLPKLVHIPGIILPVAVLAAPCAQNSPQMKLSRKIRPFSSAVKYPLQLGVLIRIHTVTHERFPLNEPLIQRSQRRWKIQTKLPRQEEEVRSRTI